MNEIGKLLIQMGILIAIIGVIIMLFSKFPHSNFPLGRLPGDIYIEKPNFKFYFPWVSCLIISVVLSLVLYFFRK